MLRKSKLYIIMLQNLKQHIKIETHRIYRQVVLDLIEPFEKAYLAWFKSNEDERPFKEFVSKHFNEYF